MRISDWSSDVCSSDLLTPEQREALRGSMTIADGDLPDIAESLIGRGNMTADERAAVDGLRREGQVAAGSPFKPGIAGDSVHAEMIDARLAELLQPVERRPYRDRKSTRLNSSH